MHSYRLGSILINIDRGLFIGYYPNNGDCVFSISIIWNYLTDGEYEEPKDSFDYLPF